MRCGPGDPSRLWALLAVAIAVTACTGAPTSPAAAEASPPATPPLTVTASPPSAQPTASLPADPPPSPAEAGASLPVLPPEATLDGLAGSAAAGALGSYTWAGSGSDGPWVVGAVSGATVAGARLAVAFGDLQPASWTAAWAKVAGAVAGSPTGDASGRGPVQVNTPGSAGDWSLRVTATFGPGANATYFWHLSVRG